MSVAVSANATGCPATVRLAAPGPAASRRAMVCRAPASVPAASPARLCRTDSRAAALAVGVATSIVKVSAAASPSASVAVQL